MRFIEINAFCRSLWQETVNYAQDVSLSHLTQDQKKIKLQVMAECHKDRCIYCRHAKVCMPLHLCKRNLTRQKEQSSKGSFMMEVICLFAHLLKQKKRKRSWLCFSSKCVIFWPDTEMIGSIPLSLFKTSSKYKELCMHVSMYILITLAQKLTYTALLLSRRLHVCEYVCMYMVTQTQKLTTHIFLLLFTRLKLHGYNNIHEYVCVYACIVALCSRK